MNKNISFVRIPFVPLAVLTAFALSAALAPSARADTEQQKSQAYQKAIQQENLQKDMASIQAELSSMRDEMRGLLPQDVAMVDKAFKQVGSLSANEMQSTIDSLREAARSGDAKAQLEKLADAYKSQTDAIHKIKGISGELAARGVRDDLTQRLTDLLRRQVADMDETARLGRSGQAPALLRDNLRQRYGVVMGDQAAVSDDVKAAIDSINTAAGNLPSDAGKFLAAAGTLIAQQHLAENATGAATLTRDGNFAQAVAAQASVVDTLAAVIHSLSSDEKVLEQLQVLSSTLGQLIDDQKSLSTAMAGQRGRNFGYEAMRRQIDISDKAGAARAELVPLNSAAAGLTGAGQVSMENAIALVPLPAGRQEREQVFPAQQTAVNNLDAAKKEIDRQIALLNSSKTPGITELIADLDDLLREVRQAAMDEGRTAVAAQMPNSPFMPTAAAQKAFHDHVDNLQQRVLPVSADAAMAIGEASQQLTNAANAAQQPAVAAAHTAAAQDLARAADILSRLLETLNTDSNVTAGIDKAIEKVKEAEKETDDAGKDLDAGKPDTAADKLTNANKALTDALEATSGTAPAAPATSALTDANKATTTAATDAKTGLVPDAQTNTTNAKVAEKKALIALENEKSNLAAKDGTEPGAPETAANDPGAGNEPAAGGGPGQGEIGDAQGAMITGAAGTTGQGVENMNLEGQAKGMAGGQTGGLGDFAGAGSSNVGLVQVVSGLAPHDRAAVAQLQREKPPREFAPEIQQYYKNLGDGTGL